MSKSHRVRTCTRTLRSQSRCDLDETRVQGSGILTFLVARKESISKLTPLACVETHVGGAYFQRVSWMGAWGEERLIKCITRKRTTPDAKPTHRRRRERETDGREGETERGTTAITNSPDSPHTRNQSSSSTISHLIGAGRIDKSFDSDIRIAGYCIFSHSHDLFMFNRPGAGRTVDKSLNPRSRLCSCRRAEGCHPHAALPER